MGCGPLFLRKPTIQDLEAMGNDLLTISDNLWTNQTHTVPYDLIGYVGRGALKNKNTGEVFAHPFVVVITQDSTICNVTGTIAKAYIETLPVATPFIYDISVDSGVSGDSFTVITGIITFREYAST